MKNEITNNPLNPLSDIEKDILRIKEMNEEQTNLLNVLIKKNKKNLSISQIKEIKYSAQVMKLTNGRLIDISYVKGSHFEEDSADFYRHVKESFHEGLYVLINEEAKRLFLLEDYYELQFEDA